MTSDVSMSSSNHYKEADVDSFFNAAGQLHVRLLHAQQSFTLLEKKSRKIAHHKDVFQSNRNIRRDDTVFLRNELVLNQFKLQKVANAYEQLERQGHRDLKLALEKIKEKEYENKRLHLKISQLQKRIQQLLKNVNHSVLQNIHDFPEKTHYLENRAEVELQPLKLTTTQDRTIVEQWRQLQVNKRIYNDEKRIIKDESVPIVSLLQKIPNFSKKLLKSKLSKNSLFAKVPNAESQEDKNSDDITPIIQLQETLRPSKSSTPQGKLFAQMPIAEIFQGISRAANKNKIS